MTWGAEQEREIALLKFLVIAKSLKSIAAVHHRVSVMQRRTSARLSECAGTTAYTPSVELVEPTSSDSNGSGSALPRRHETSGPHGDEEQNGLWLKTQTF